jgi:hypothetical protein
MVRFHLQDAGFYRAETSISNLSGLFADSLDSKPGFDEQLVNYNPLATWLKNSGPAVDQKKSLEMRLLAGC